MSVQAEIFVGLRLHKCREQNFDHCLVILNLSSSFVQQLLAKPSLFLEASVFRWMGRVRARPRSKARSARCRSFRRQAGAKWGMGCSRRRGKAARGAFKEETGIRFGTVHNVIGTRLPFRKREASGFQSCPPARSEKRSTRSPDLSASVHPEPIEGFDRNVPQVCPEDSRPLTTRWRSLTTSQIKLSSPAAASCARISSAR